MLHRGQTACGRIGIRVNDVEFNVGASCIHEECGGAKARSLGGGEVEIRVAEVVEDGGLQSGYTTSV